MVPRKPALYLVRWYYFESPHLGHNIVDEGEVLGGDHGSVVDLTQADTPGQKSKPSLHLLLRSTTR